MPNWTVILPKGTPIPKGYHYYIVGEEIMIPAIWKCSAESILETDFHDVKNAYIEPRPIGFFADFEVHHGG